MVLVGPPPAPRGSPSPRSPRWIFDCLRQASTTIVIVGISALPTSLADERINGAMVASFALLLTVSCPNKFPVTARPASYAAQVAEPGEAREVRAIEDQRALQLPAAALRQLAVGSDVVVGRVDQRPGDRGLPIRGSQGRLLPALTVASLAACRRRGLRRRPDRSERTLMTRSAAIDEQAASTNSANHFVIPAKMWHVESARGPATRLRAVRLQAGGAIGIVNQKVAPRPGALSMPIWPPDASTMRFEMVSPRPVPLAPPTGFVK